MGRNFIIVMTALIFTGIYGAIIFFFIRHWKTGKVQTSLRVKKLIKEKAPDSPREETEKQNRQSRTSMMQTLADIPFYERAIRPVLRKIKRFILLFAPTEIYDMIQRRIVLAGKHDVWRVQYFAAAWVISVFGCTFLTFLFVTEMQLKYSQILTAVVLAPIVGGCLPFLYMRSVIKKRQNIIWRQMPAVLDLLSVSVQAGLSFDAAVSKITNHMKGPLIDEFRIMQREMRIGITRRTSLENLAERCDLDEVYLFTNSVIQADQLGTSMSRTLVDQANNIRDIYRQWVKAESLKAPIKILFPMAIFIFPAIFVIVLIPPLLTIIEGLHF